MAPERLDWRTLIKAPDDTPQVIVSTLDTYFTRFAQPAFDKNHPCLNCGARACGFVFGIVTGAGHCYECGWPAVRDHYIGVTSFHNVVLQYHPDFVDRGNPDPFSGFPFRVKPERQKETAS